MMYQNQTLDFISAVSASSTKILTSWYCKAINGKAKPAFLLNQNLKGMKLVESVHSSS